MGRRFVDPEFAATVKRLRADRGLTVRALAKAAVYSSAYIGEIETGRKEPTREAAVRLDDALDAHGVLAAMVTVGGDGNVPGVRAAAGIANPSETAELLGRLRASDTVPGTLESLQSAIVELCCDYGWRDAGELRAEGQLWLREVSKLLYRPVGLAAHRELLVAAGWLALLVGCVEYDLGMRAGAEATRIAARSLGEEAGHPEIVGWAYEMSAWFALTQGRHRNVLQAARAGEQAAPRGSAAVQLHGQEAKALARLGDIDGVRAALGRGRVLLDALPYPDRPDHHFIVDPAKWDFYAMDAYRLAADDELAAEHARDVLRLGVSTMRMSEAKLTLAAVAARRGDLDEAVTTAVDALGAGRRSLPSLLMVAGEVDVELHRRYPGERAVGDFRSALRAIGS